MFEPRRGAGDGEEGRRCGDPHAEWPSGESSPQVRQLSRKTCDVRFLRLEGDQLGERRAGGLKLLTTQGRAGRGDAVVDPSLFRAEFDPFVRLSRRRAFGGKGGLNVGPNLGRRHECDRRLRSRQYTFP
jgi:hypothetical protein